MFLQVSRIVCKLDNTESNVVAVAHVLLLQDRMFSLCYALHIHDITKILANVFFPQNNEDCYNLPPQLPDIYMLSCYVIPYMSCI